MKFSLALFFLLATGWSTSFACEYREGQEVLYVSQGGAAAWVAGLDGRYTFLVSAKITAVEADCQTLHVENEWWLDANRDAWRKYSGTAIIKRIYVFVRTDLGLDRDGKEFSVSKAVRLSRKRLEIYTPGRFASWNSDDSFNLPRVITAIYRRADEAVSFRYLIATKNPENDSLEYLLTEKSVKKIQTLSVGDLAFYSKRGYLGKVVAVNEALTTYTLDITYGKVGYLVQTEMLETKRVASDKTFRVLYRGEKWKVIAELENGELLLDGWKYTVPPKSVTRILD